VTVAAEANNTGARIPGDAPIPLGTKRLPAAAELTRVVDACSFRSPLKIEIAVAPLNALNRSFVEPSKGALTCREGIERTLLSVSRILVYQLMDDITDQILFLSIVPAHQLTIDSKGHQVLVPVK
jgi:hypothetical protein